MAQVDLSGVTELVVTVKTVFRYEAPILTSTTDRIIGSELISWQYMASGTLEREGSSSWFSAVVPATGVWQEVWQTHDETAGYVQTKNANVSGDGDGEVTLRVRLGHLGDAPNVAVYSIDGMTLNLVARESSYFYTATPIPADVPMTQTFTGEARRDVGFSGIQSWPLPEEGKPIEGTTTKPWGRGQATLTWSIARKDESSQPLEKCYGGVSLVGPGPPGFIYGNAAALGIVAHRMIGGDYESRLGLQRGVNLHVDFQEPRNVNPDYVLFLLENNPHLTYHQIRRIVRARSYRRPDLLMHVEPTDLEFDEIKSDSPSGRTKGVNHVNEVAEWLEAHDLPYVPGTGYVTGSQVRYIPLVDVQIGINVIGMRLRISRMPYEGDAPGTWPQDGLILYRYCMYADWKKMIRNAAVLLALLFILAKIIDAIRSGEPMPEIELPPELNPVKPIPERQPLPERPQPQPVPVTRARVTPSPQLEFAIRSLSEQEYNDFSAWVKIDELTNSRHLPQA